VLSSKVAALYSAAAAFREAGLALAAERLEHAAPCERASDPGRAPRRPDKGLGQAL
jgi:hypothetical protein